ncbi:MAG: PD40 domain-containing protein [Anaerolineae bacterium]|nr:PD40 domain-containing protein [Anaerolineae bacterium]
MITKRHSILAVLLSAGFFLVIIVLRVLQGGSSFGLGRLIFTDYAKPDYRNTVNLFDLTQGRRSTIPEEAYQNVGFIYPIDAQHVYISMCFAQNNPLFCSAHSSNIIDAKDSPRFENMTQFWKNDYSSPVWSPDGTHIAFGIVTRNTQNNGLALVNAFVMKADGTHLLDLTPGEDDNGFYFTWSPDSQRVAFTCSNEQKVCIIGADGSQLQALSVPNDSSVRDLEWSPDGRQIIFTVLANDFHNSELYLINADGSNLHRLLEAGSDLQAEAKWSPDSSQIAFTAGQRGRAEIYVIKADGTDLRNLSRGLNGNDFGAVWSPDSLSVVFFSWQNQKNLFLYMADTNRSIRQKITDNSTFNSLDAGAPELFWIP